MRKTQFQGVVQPLRGHLVYGNFLGFLEMLKDSLAFLLFWMQTPLRN